MDSIFRSFRQKVSADKNRYRQGDFDLDLTYITSRVIAMAYPAVGVESTYRNNIDDVARMLKQSHPGHFMIYNLANRPYDKQKFDGLVVDWCGFPDHHPPPLALMFRIVHDMDAWLQADPDNVIVVHCLAGKGRTGTLIAAYFMYCGLFDQMDEALNFFAYRRSLNVWGVTGPSQKRFVRYFEDIVLRARQPASEAVMLTMLKLNDLPRFTLSRGEKGCAPVFDIYVLGREAELIFSSTDIAPDVRTFPSSRKSVQFYVNCALRGDILIHFRHMNPLLGSEPMFHFVFSTQMLSRENKLLLQRHEIEKANKDPRFPGGFSIELEFHPLSRSAAQYFQAEHEERFMEQQMELEGSNAGDVVVNATTLLNLVPSDDTLKEEQRLWEKRASVRSGAICFTGSTENKIEIARDIGNPALGNVAVKGGWLLKRGHSKKSWKRRWFVLRASSLSYHKGPRELKTLGVIPVTFIREIRYVRDESDDHLNCFEVVTFQTRYVVSAECQEDMRAWASAIVYARNLHLNQGHGSKKVGSLKVDILDVEKLHYEGEISCTVVLGEQKQTVSAVSSIPSSMDGEKRESGVVFNETVNFAVTDGCTELSIALWENDEVVGKVAIPMDVVRSNDEIDRLFTVLDAEGKRLATSVHLVIVYEDAVEEMIEAQFDLLFISEQFSHIRNLMSEQPARHSPEHIQPTESGIGNGTSVAKEARLRNVSTTMQGVMSMSDSHLDRRLSHLGERPRSRSRPSDEHVGSMPSSVEPPPPPQYPAPARPDAVPSPSAPVSPLAMYANAWGMKWGGNALSPAGWSVREHSPEQESDSASGSEDTSEDAQVVADVSGEVRCQRIDSAPLPSSGMNPLQERIALFRHQFDCKCEPLSCMLLVEGLLYSGNDAGNIHIWDPETGVQKLCFKAHQGRVHAMVFDSVSRLWSTADDSVCVYDVKKLKLLKRFKRHKAPVSCLSYVGLPGRGQVWGSSSLDRSATIIVWDASELSCIKQFELGHSAVGCLRASRNNMWVGLEDFLLCFDTESFQTVLQLRVGSGMIRAVAVLDDIVWFCSRGSSRISVWNTATNCQIKTLTSHEAVVNDISCTGTHVWTCSADLHINVWSLGLECMERVRTPHTGPVTRLIRTGPQTVCSTSTDGTICVWTLGAP